MMSPVSTALCPNVPASMKGTATIPSICAVNESMLVTTDIENIGILRRSKGSMGYFFLICMRT